MIKSIDTFYNGYRFRSRLEARWAVFFDTLSIKWEYEPEGFVLSNGENYLPDFKVKGINSICHWSEIKPLGDPGNGKLEQFEKDYNSQFKPPDYNLDVFFSLLSGDPWDVLGSSIESIEDYYFNVTDSPSQYYYFKGKVLCPRCGHIGFMEIYDFEKSKLGFICYPCDYDTPCGGDNPPEQGLLAEVTPRKGWLIVDPGQAGSYITKIKRACDAARSARFEFLTGVK